MASTKPLEQLRLANAETVLGNLIKKFSPPEEVTNTRLSFLQHLACYYSGVSHDWLAAKTKVDSQVSFDRKSVGNVAELIDNSGVPPVLAISSLCRSSLSETRQKQTGSYYTDFRLAQYLAQSIRSDNIKDKLVIDPACGTGMLLAATALQEGRNSKKRLNTFIANCLAGADTSKEALRGTKIVLASLTNDTRALASAFDKLKNHDSLIEGATVWRREYPSGVGAVIANPPWEKLKITRHELLRARGSSRHYGSQYSDVMPDIGYERDRVRTYLRGLGSSYQLQGRGEFDLYKLFLELSLQILDCGGMLGILVPAGLIRSLGTENLRKKLIDTCSVLDISILENRSKYFSIDTRFKFLAVSGQIKNGRRRQPIQLSWTSDDGLGLSVNRRVSISRIKLAQSKSSFAIPEVRTLDEWQLYTAMQKNSVLIGDNGNSGWIPKFCREVDMTRDKRHFQNINKNDVIPLIEGRMIHQYRFAAKRYVSGTGRRAKWEPEHFDSIRKLKPQFYFPISKASVAARKRLSEWRVGFCDITGQTNERTMLASRVPPNTICGNKVPTVVFDTSTDQRTLSDCWLAIVNSLSFDWLIRRNSTTTINYFLLLQIPFPRILPTSKIVIELARLVSEIHEIKRDLWEIAERRARIESIVLRYYGQSPDSLKVIMQDFPLLDRGQPELPGESQSTITRDFVLLRTMDYFSYRKETEYSSIRDRVNRARDHGAVPFIPSQFSSTLKA